MPSPKLLLRVLVFLCFGGELVLAQVITGTISGTVSDDSGSVVPGATISVRNTNTGISRNVNADAAGRYTVPRLALGDYEVKAGAPGFQTLVHSGITLTVGREATVDLVLKVGAVAETITVTGEAPLVESTTATVSGLVDEATMRDLPLNGRSFGDLSATQPGVVSDLPYAGGATAVFNSGGAASRHVIAGAKPTESTFLLDGAEVTTPSTGMPVNSVLGQQLGVEAIREFTLLQNNFGAQFGRAAGGVVNAVTQSGTNSLHGSAFEFFRNTVLDAKDFFLQTTQPKAPDVRNQFGGALGGPIQKDRTFFFINYEAVRQRGGVPRVGSTLTPETRLGLETGCPSGLTSCSREQSVVTTTLTVNPDIKIFFPLLPLPNGPYRGGGIADYRTDPLWKATENYGSVRIDRQLSRMDSLFGRLTIDRSSRTDNFELLTPQPYIGSQSGGYVLGAISWTRVINPKVLNTVRVSFTRRNDHLFNNYARGGSQFPNAPGLDPRLSAVPGLPLTSWAIAGVNLYGGIGSGLASGAAYVDNIFDYDDSVNLNWGRHSIAIGGDMQRYQSNILMEAWSYGTFSWLTIERFLTNQPFSNVQFIGTQNGAFVAPDMYRGWRQAYGAAYVQDDFKVNSNLTLNLGVRWERLGSPHEVNGKLAVLKNLYKDPTFTPLSKSDPYFTIRDGLKNLSPRIGLAWSPFSDHKTVIRAGFGTFNELITTHSYRLAMEAPPYAVRYQVNAPALVFPFPFSAANAPPLSGSRQALMLPLDVKQPYTLQWTVSLERQVGQSFVIKLNYIGKRGVNQLLTYNPDQAQEQVVNGRLFLPALTVAPPPNPNFSFMRYLGSVADLYYHAAQLVVEKRLSAGLRFNSSYTFSRNIDNGGPGTEGTESFAGSAVVMYNSGNFAQDKGLSSLHIQHNFITSFTYDLPFGAGRRWGGNWKGVVDHILGGWDISGTNSIRSGLPLNITETPRQSGCPSTGTECPERPDLRSGGNNNPVLKNWTPNQYFNPSNFAVQPVGFFGNVGKNTLIRPGIFNVNISLSKETRLGETRRLDFRAELFNLLNHPNFGAPSGNVFRDALGNFDPNAGRITTTDTSMRQVQFGLKLIF